MTNSIHGIKIKIIILVILQENYFQEMNLLFFRKIVISVAEFSQNLFLKIFHFLFLKRKKKT